jgi:hypothetical protein
MMNTTSAGANEPSSALDMFFMAYKGRCSTLKSTAAIPALISVYSHWHYETSTLYEMCLKTVHR